MCPDHLTPRIDRSAWTPPAVFDWLQSEGAIETDEMHRTFNMGIGLVFAVPADKAGQAMTVLSDAGETPVIIGDLANG